MQDSKPQRTQLEEALPRHVPVRYICTLVFEDGRKVSGRISAWCRCEESAVEYTGAVKRLPFAFATADAVLLRATFQSLARKLKAKFREETVGDWSPPESLLMRRYCRVRRR